ncbi:hypothetical protein L1987_67859 [Smallanthus sonchifolius]|uniref:Uncharacterized protein n=1 Tax=Smallanthus sonchifolius TaxID=185202 RepID=A0ACB9B476_9ASTR|nr:hypothetical protein L1987_67859 [Smallanthus sonchifolius]
MMRGNNIMVDNSMGNCYQHVNSSSNPFEVYNFELHNSVSHNKGPSLFSSKPITDSDFYHFEEPSPQRCVFPCEPNERTSQGLFLSLSSANPSTIELQSFELVRPQEHHQHQQGSDGDGGGYNHDQAAQDNIRSSRYLLPTQELLNEFCNLGSKQSDHSLKVKTTTTSNQWQDHDILNNASSSKTKSLSSLEFLELQTRKTKLLQMLEEVDRRYKHYCDQMKAVVSSFEAIAGQDATKVYSSLASKAMSRQFRCLRDGIVSQIKTTKDAMGEKDVSVPGASRGETPRLRVLDQTLRQQRAFLQMTMMDSHAWRPQRGLPERSVSVLRAWLFEHFLNP